MSDYKIVNLLEIDDSVAGRLDGLEGRKAVAIVEACYRSARTGRMAKVD